MEIWSTTLFKVTRGVRQGCPLSPYLFILAAEILAIYIRNNPDIEGIHINNSESKISQYADDTALSLLYSAKTIATVKQTFDSFEIISGLKVNYDKTQILRIGSVKGLDCTLCPEINMKWTNEPIPLLGIDITPDISHLLEINYRNVVKKIRSSADLWKRRKLTHYGKIVIIKTFLISQIIYKASVLPNPPTEIIEDVKKIIMAFLWDNKQPRIKKEVLYNGYENGGLKLPHLDTILKANKITWVKRFMLADNKCMWKVLAQNTFRIQDTGLLFEMNATFVDLQNLLKARVNSFWIDVLKAWCDYNHKNPIDKYSIQQQVIWYNSFIRVNGKPCFYKKWLEKGVCRIKDLMKNGDLFLSYVEFKNKYDISCDYLSYYGLIQAVPKPWKTILRGQNLLKNNENKLVTICNTKKATKATYTNLIDEVCEFPHSPVNKWEEELNNYFPIAHWQSLFQNIYITVKSAKLRYFQFQVLHRTLVTNRKLKLWNIKDSDRCSFCEIETETISHLLYDCLHIKIFWYRAKKWASEKLGNQFNPNISKTDFLLGSSGDNRLLNLICLVAKQYIYSCRCLGNFPNLAQYINKLRDIRHSELYFARYGEKYDQLERFWDWLN